MYLAETLTLAAQAPVSGSQAPAGSNGSPAGGADASNPEGQFQNLLQQKHQAGLSTTEPSPLPAAIALLPDTPLYQELAAALMAPPAMPQMQQFTTPAGEEGPQPAGAAPLSLIAEAPVTQPALTTAEARPPLNPTVQTAAPSPISNPQQAQVPGGTPPPQTESGTASFASVPEQTTVLLKQGDPETAALSQGQEAPAKPLFQSSEPLPVKVGETPVLPADSSDFELQLGKQLSQSLAQGTQKLSIRLTPEHLGTMVVEFTRSQDGTLHVLLNASNPEAASLLSQHKTGLSTLLQHNVQAPVYVEVQQQDAAQSSQQQNQQQQHNQGDAQQDSRQHRQQEQKQNQEDFLAQLRLGLVSFGTEAS